MEVSGQLHALPWKNNPRYEALDAAVKRKISTPLGIEPLFF
jgi:hypothetical protein